MRLQTSQTWVPVFMTLFSLAHTYAQSFKAPLNSDRVEGVVRELQKVQSFDIDALEIRAKIHEPALIYILNRPDFHIHFDEEALRLTPRIRRPILRNNFE